MKNKTTLWLRLGAGLYLILYTLEFYELDLQSIVWDAEQVSVVGMMVLFTMAFIVSWFSDLIGAILFQLWHFLVWVFALSIWTDSGMALVLALPILPLSVFMLYYSLKERDKMADFNESKWKVILQQLMIHYFLLMALITFVSPNRTEEFSLLSYPYFFILVMFAIVFVGFVLSWKNKRLAGYALIAWYGLAIVMRYTFPEIPDQEGPILMFGLPILIQGILYIKYDSSFSRTLSPS